MKRSGLSEIIRQTLSRSGSRLSPAVLIGIVDFDTATGLVQHVGFRGRARLEPHNADRMKRLFTRYMGELEQWDSRFVRLLDDPDYIFVRFEPETVVVRDQSYKLSQNDRI